MSWGAEFFGNSLNILRYDLPWTRINGRLTDLQRQSRFGHAAHPRAGVKPNPRSFPQTYLGPDDGPVGHIGIIACIFFNGRHGNIFGLACLNQSKRRALASGQDNFHRIWEMSREQSLIGRTRSRRGAGPSGPAFAKLPNVLVR